MPKSKQKSIPPSKCPRCQMGTTTGDEVFYHRKRTYKFDVDKAIEIVSDGREPIEADPDTLRWAIRNTEIYDEHLPHVNIGRPGILANVTYPLENGESLFGHLLIDGNHRAARCLKEGIPFFIYVLTEEETKQSLLRSPKTIPLDKVLIRRRSAKGKKSAKRGGKTRRAVQAS